MANGGSSGGSKGGSSSSGSGRKSSGLGGISGQGGLGGGRTLGSSAGFGGAGGGTAPAPSAPAAQPTTTQAPPAAQPSRIASAIDKSPGTLSRTLAATGRELSSIGERKAIEGVQAGEIRVPGVTPTQLQAQRFASFQRGEDIGGRPPGGSLAELRNIQEQEQAQRQIQAAFQQRRQIPRASVNKIFADAERRASLQTQTAEVSVKPKVTGGGISGVGGPTLETTKTLIVQDALSAKPEKTILGLIRTAKQKVEEFQKDVGTAGLLGPLGVITKKVFIASKRETTPGIVLSTGQGTQFPVKAEDLFTPLQGIKTTEIVQPTRTDLGPKDLGFVELKGEPLITLQEIPKGSLESQLSFKAGRAETEGKSLSALTFATGAFVIGGTKATAELVSKPETFVTAPAEFAGETLLTGKEVITGEGERLSALQTFGERIKTPGAQPFSELGAFVIPGILTAGALRQTGVGVSKTAKTAGKSLAPKEVKIALSVGTESRKTFPTGIPDIDLITTQSRQAGTIDVKSKGGTIQFEVVSKAERTAVVKPGTGVSATEATAQIRRTGKPESVIDVKLKSTGKLERPVPGGPTASVEIIGSRIKTRKGFQQTKALSESIVTRTLDDTILKQVTTTQLGKPEIVKPQKRFVSPAEARDLLARGKLPKLDVKQTIFERKLGEQLTSIEQASRREINLKLIKERFSTKDVAEVLSDLENIKPKSLQVKKGLITGQRVKGIKQTETIIPSKEEGLRTISAGINKKLYDELERKARLSQQEEVRKHAKERQEIAKKSVQQARIQKEKPTILEQQSKDSTQRLSEAAGETLLELQEETKKTTQKTKPEVSSPISISKKDLERAAREAFLGQPEVKGERARIQTTRTIGRTLQGQRFTPRTISGQKQQGVPQLRIEKEVRTELGLRPEQSIVPEQKQVLRPIQGLVPRQELIPRLTQVLQPIQPQQPGVDVPLVPLVPAPPFIPIPLLPSLGFPGGTPSRAIRAKLPRSRFKPSITAIEGQIFGQRPETITGVEARAVPVEFKQAVQRLARVFALGTGRVISERSQKRLGIDSILPNLPKTPRRRLARI